MIYTCKQCGAHNEDPLAVDTLPGWQAVLQDRTRIAVQARKFDKGSGELTDGKSYRTLWLSFMLKCGLLESPDDVLTALQAEYALRVAPVLETLVAQVNVLGHFCLPSTIELARTDLTRSWACFCFLTVEDSPGLVTKLEELGLHSLFIEGAVQTLGEKYCYGVFGPVEPARKHLEAEPETVAWANCATQDELEKCLDEVDRFFKETDEGN